MKYVSGSERLFMRMGYKPEGKGAKSWQAVYVKLRPKILVKQPVLLFERDDCTRPIMQKVRFAYFVG